LFALANDLGALEAGKIADIVAAPGDPLQDRADGAGVVCDEGRGALSKMIGGEAAFQNPADLNEQPVRPEQESKRVTEQSERKASSRQSFYPPFGRYRVRPK
jgi:hypothetical protein